MPVARAHTAWAAKMASANLPQEVRVRLPPVRCLQGHWDVHCPGRVACYKLFRRPGRHGRVGGDLENAGRWLKWEGIT